MRESGREELSNLLVLDPQWLMDVMKVIMELKTENAVKLSTFEALQLCENGVASIKTLEVCWGDLLSKSPCINIRHLCLMLQSYGLIYPVQPKSVCRSRGTAEFDLQEDEFIIPCKFPDSIHLCQNRIPRRMSFTFYIKFNFLPEEIYCKLICLASAESKPMHDGCNCYSKRNCFFTGLLDTNWIIEIEQENQRLMIMVL